MPAYTHDAPLIGFENQYLIDETNMFNGSLDRFNWKLIGKREMIVPYNDFGMYAFNTRLRDVATPNGNRLAARGSCDAYRSGDRGKLKADSRLARRGA